VSQLELLLPSCKFGCAAPIVGHSITGEGHVCKWHNAEEWGRSLASNPESYYRRLGSQLLADATRLPSPVGGVPILPHEREDE
jgi:hypothetical protein